MIKLLLDAVPMQLECSQVPPLCAPLRFSSHDGYLFLFPSLSYHIENFLFSTSNALASSWNPLAISPAAAPPLTAAPEPRGLLVALLLPFADALLGSEFDGVGFGCSSADRLALLALPTGDRDRARGGGVELWTEGRGPGMDRPGPGDVPTAWVALSCRCCERGDSSLILICARCGDHCCGVCT